MTKTIRTILSSLLGFCVGYGIGGLLRGVLFEIGWWAPVAVISVPFITGIIAGILCDGLEDILKIIFGTGLAVFLFFIAFIIIGALVFLITDVPFLVWATIPCALSLIAAPVGVIVLILGD